MFEHVIFDFDGVISNSFTVAVEELNRIAGQKYPSIPKAVIQEDLAYVYCGPLKTSLRRFGLDDDQSRDFFNLHSAAMQNRASEIQPFDEIVNIIAEVVPGKCSIVTSSYSDAVRLILSKNPMYSDSLFKFISGRELNQKKTDKITDVLQALGIPYCHSLYVGDMVSDVLYSKTVPIACCAVGWGYHPLSYLLAFAPDFAVGNPTELRHFLAEKVR